MNASSGSFRVIPVTSEADYEAFLSLPQEVYNENPHWVPPEPNFASAEVRGQTAFAEGCRLQPFIAESGGRVVARAVALVSDVYDRHWKEHAGHVSLFEAMPDFEPEAISLLQTVKVWLREQGCTFVRQGFFLGWTMPLTIDAYHQRPTTFHTYNPPFYHRYIKNAGFQTEKGIVEYQVRFDDTLATEYRAMAARAEENGIRLRSWDFDHLELESSRMATLYNETFAHHWAAAPMSNAQWAGMTIDMKEHLVPEALAWAEEDGKLAGGVYGLPDLYQQAVGVPLDHGILLTIGVREPFRGRGVNTALGAKCFLGFLERGYKSASYTVVLDDNWPSRRTAEKLGCRVARNYVVYRSELGR